MLNLSSYNYNTTESSSHTLIKDLETCLKQCYLSQKGNNQSRKEAFLKFT